ncbi:hypothetical protein PR001_g4357 [Phytophthora rubi]|uniref:Uncharacterized protein n=1 Tax=Phytophthora rubi TaxID=129364 RepID=A0A6A3P380_9STRA|nr:hypothetical protein PR001_g4357 [Phytophthora rubi]
MATVDQDWAQTSFLLGIVTEAAGAAVVSAGRSSRVRPLARNLVDELDDVAKPELAFGDDDDDESDVKGPKHRPPLNGDTSAANKVLGRYLELTKTKSNWMRQFSPKIVRPAVWMDLGGVLAIPIDPTSTRQVARKTELLLRAMGCESHMYPPDMALADWTPNEAAAALMK